MEINYIITYEDSISGDRYEDHAVTLEEAKDLQETIQDEGWVNVKIEKVRIK